MNSEGTLLEGILGNKVRPLDRRPGLSSGLVTVALLLCASRSAPLFNAAADFLQPSIEWSIAQWPWLFAAALTLISLSLDSIVTRLRAIRKSLCRDGTLLLALLILVGSLFYSAGHVSDLRLTLLGLGIWGFLYVLRFEPVNLPTPTQDSLHRHYFTERLAEVIAESGDSLSKIAVHGPWGSGKTVVLKLLRDALGKQSEQRWRMAWVNPWQARTPEEAWATLAMAVDAALGNKPSFPRNWMNHPVLVWLAGLLPNADLTPELVEFFSGDQSSLPERRAIDRINGKISSRLDTRRERLLILVDDMERCDPTVLRGLLPVIDRLQEIGACQFVFAIDPTRVADAFEEKDPNAPLTKGYLDKVFDLQIPLPRARKPDIQKLILEKANTGTTPILAAALKVLAEHLPENPRLALRFFETAKAKERMFLHRFEVREVPALHFFLCWIIETEFKGFLEAVLRPESLTLFDEVCLNPLMSSDRERPSDHKNFPVLVDLLASTLLGETRAPEKPRLQNLISALTSLTGNSLDWVSEFSRKFELQWIAHGHTHLEDLSLPEITKLQATWTKDAGVHSIQRMIHESLQRRDFCDEARCARQLLDREVEEIRSVCSREDHPTRRLGNLGPMLGRIELLRIHFNFSHRERLEFDISLYDTDFFYRWLEFIAQVSLEHSRDPQAKLIQQAREEFHLSIVHSLSLRDTLIAISYGISTKIDLNFAGRVPDRTRDYLARLRKFLMKRITGGFVEMFRDGTLSARGLPDELQTGGPQFFLRPENWLWLEDDEWKSQLDSLVSEAEENPNIANACVWLSKALFFHHPQSGLHGGTQGIIQDIAQNRPDYLHFFWNSALKSEPEAEDFKILLRERKRAGETESVSAALLDKHFPMPASALETTSTQSAKNLDVVSDKARTRA